MISSHLDQNIAVELCQVVCFFTPKNKNRTIFCHFDVFTFVLPELLVKSFNYTFQLLPTSKTLILGFEIRNCLKSW